MTDQEAAFLSDLKALLERHGVYLSGDREYIGDQFINTVYTVESREDVEVDGVPRLTVYLTMEQIEHST